MSSVTFTYNSLSYRKLELIYIVKSYIYYIYIWSVKSHPIGTSHSISSYTEIMLQQIKQNFGIGY